MVKGIGIDICNIGRMEKFCQNPRFKDRVFTTTEQQYAENRGMFKFSSYAGMFAAKEAFSKAVGTGIGGITFLDIEVLHEINGRPSIALYRAAEKTAKTMGVKQVFISISHEKDNAVAAVVLEG
ncbi:MAG: holo-ACP synthase [Eubacteriales bacterium]|nr:holo-ACP synthase [Eubacteriales bacterium]